MFGDLSKDIPITDNKTSHDCVTLKIINDAALNHDNLSIIEVILR